MHAVTTEASSSSTAIVQGIAKRLKSAREARHLSASELARRAAIAKSTLTQLEAGHGNPSVETLWALATALDVPFARLIEAPAPSVHIVRAGQGTTTFAEHSAYTATLLAARPPGPTHNIYRIRLEAGAERRSNAHPAGTVEHLFVAHGAMHAGPANGPADLEAGDYMTFPGDVDHVYAATDGPATALLIMEYE